MTSIDDNANNGMLTKIWGKSAWNTVHCITFGYMVRFDETNPEHVKRKEGIKNTLINLSHCWPCIYCRESYNQFITDENSPSFISDKIFESRDSLTRWGFLLHQKVNEKLGVDYGLSYEDIVPIYESFRAKCIDKDKGCTMPINLKAQSYLMAEIRHAPVVSYDFAVLFTKYAKVRGINNYKKFLKSSDILLNKKDRMNRDNICVKIINHMRKSSIDCIESSGKYKDLPTLHELILLSMRCSNISSNLHKDLINRLNNLNL